MLTLLDEKVEVEDSPGALQYKPDGSAPPDIEFRC